ncbi:MAG: YdcF family protein [Planctomycetes bacterium]|nr:YdcF family protein [Planctomycetota bacterium]
MSDSQTEKSDSASPKAGRAGRIVRRMIRIAGWIIAAIFILACLYVFTPLGNAAYDGLVAADDNPPAAGVAADYIVVLGGGNDRIIEAANLYRQGRAPKIIISTSGPDVADLADLAKQYGVPPANLLLETQSRCTADHPGKIAALPGIDPRTTRLIVVTSPVHSSRAKACFLKAGYRNFMITYPGWQKKLSVPTNWMGRAVQMPAVVYEYLAWGYYRLRDRL